MSTQQQCTAAVSKIYLADAAEYLLGRSGCIVGHRFEPGPIVGWHNRQPTIREFQTPIEVVTAELARMFARDDGALIGSIIATWAVGPPYSN